MAGFNVFFIRRFHCNPLIRNNKESQAKHYFAPLEILTQKPPKYTQALDYYSYTCTCIKYLLRPPEGMTHGLYSVLACKWLLFIDEDANEASGGGNTNQQFFV